MVFAFFTAIDTLRGQIMKDIDVYGESIMYGHTHDLQRFTKTRKGGTISAWSLGCLKDIEIDEEVA